MRVFADLSELSEEQAKIRAKFSALSVQVSKLVDGKERTTRHLETFKATLKGVIGQAERLSDADDLHSKQFGQLVDTLHTMEVQLQAHQNTLLFLRKSDGQQQQSINRLKQSRITLTHILLLGILLMAGAGFALDVDKARNFGARLQQLEYRYPSYP
ncbi:MAG: hypothetical protein AB8B99_18900 [Phormidesmis sp.]